MIVLVRCFFYFLVNYDCNVDENVFCLINEVIFIEFDI